jgi:hypothetical protein
MKGYINMMKLLVELSTGWYSSVCIAEYWVNLSLVYLEAVLKMRRESINRTSLPKK